MADGAIIGRRAALAQFDHTDGTQQVVASVTLPSVEGYYHVMARVRSGKSDDAQHVAWLIMGDVTADAGAAIVKGQNEVSKHDLNASGYAATLTVSGLAVQVSVTAASGVRSFAMLEVFGVEQVITPA